MYIEHREYLALLDQIEYLKKDAALLREENVMLTEELIKQREKRLQSEDNHVKNMKLVEELHSKALTQQSQNTKQIMQKIADLEKQRKEFLQTKFYNLQNSSLLKQKTLEAKYAKTKVDMFELAEFANTLKRICKQSQGSQNKKAKKQPTFLQVIKWVKSLPGVVATNGQKSGLNPSMSASHLKKSHKGGKLKQNKSILNHSQSKPVIKISESMQLV